MRILFLEISSLVYKIHLLWFVVASLVLYLSHAHETLDSKYDIIICSLRIYQDCSKKMDFIKIIKCVSGRPLILNTIGIITPFSLFPDQTCPINSKSYKKIFESFGNEKQSSRVQQWLISKDISMQNNRPEHPPHPP